MRPNCTHQYLFEWKMERNEEHLRVLNLFRNQYLQLIDVRGLAWPDSHSIPLAAHWVQEWLFNNLFNNDQIRYLPPPRYQLRVLKELTSWIEQAIQDPNEEVGAVFFLRILLFLCPDILTARKTLVVILEK